MSGVEPKLEKFVQAFYDGWLGKEAGRYDMFATEAGIESLVSRLPGESFPVDRILFNKGRVTPRTTSGKKRHFFCRKLLQSGELIYQMQIEVTPGRIADH